MSWFLSYLHNEARNTFTPTELNEIILMVYSVIERAVREDADLLTLLDAGFVWTRDGQPIGLSPIIIQPRVSFREALELIIVRDTGVGQHLQQVSVSPHHLTYRII